MKENELSCNRYSKTKNVSGFRKDKNEYIKTKMREKPIWCKETIYILITFDVYGKVYHSEDREAL